jgi:hypothetical protein
VEVGVKIVLDASFHDILEWNGIWDKAKEVNSTKAYVINDEIFR